MELAVYAGLASLALLAIVSLFAISKRTQRHTYSSYLVGGRVASAIRVLRRDFQMTALPSIQAYPNSGDSGERPGASFVSAYSLDKGDFQVNDYGAPKWVKHVFYTIRPDADAKSGQLVRWEQGIDPVTLLPELASKLPSDITGDDQRVVLENVVLPSVTIDNVGEGGSYTASEWGGFEVKFVRREGGEAGAETLTSENPTTSDDPEDNTRLVDITLRTVSDERSNTPTLYEIKLRVCPRY